MNAWSTTPPRSTRPGHRVRLAALLFGALSVLASVSSANAVGAERAGTAQVSATEPEDETGWNWAYVDNHLKS